MFFNNKLFCPSLLRNEQWRADWWFLHRISDTFLSGNQFSFQCMLKTFMPFFVMILGSLQAWSYKQYTCRYTPSPCLTSCAYLGQLAFPFLFVSLASTGSSSNFHQISSFDFMSTNTLSEDSVVVVGKGILKLFSLLIVCFLHV